ncbi:GNAT family N-acetyltransferase [Gracilibacillus timonensis]|uniref:GNAT family N-acetyltransferase n=1 Tax=Gracilibacillus timonensis TaxID=1816696 RepID=UPI000825A552|nr:GNAT family N-acetyltransferase [Gracilibacillus timonensis]
MLEIREVQPDDIKAVSTFIQRTMEEVYPFPLTDASKRDLVEIETLFLTPSNTAMIAAFSDQEVVGTIAIRPYDGRITALDSRYDDENTCEIIKCYVKPDRRQQGIGSLLFQQALTFCRQSHYSIMYLHTHRFLPGGLTFWKKKGFALVLAEEGELETVHLEKRV